MNTITLRRTRLVAGAAGLTLLLAACASAGPSATVSPTPVGTTASATPSSSASSSASPSASAATSSPGATSTAALLDGVRLSAGDGATAALAAVGSGRVVAIELEREHGTVVWRVDVLTADAIRELDVDAATGAVLANRIDSDGDDVQKTSLLANAASVDHAAALRLAEAQVSGGRVVDLKLDDDHDAPVWKVDLVSAGPTQHEVTIDAASGAVTKREG